MIFKVIMTICLSLALEGLASAQVSDYAKRLADAISACGGNGASSVFAFDPATFDAKAAMANLKKLDADRDCTKDHSYSISKENAVRLALTTITTNSDTRDCLDENVSRADRRRFEETLKDPRNLGVFASEIVASSNNPEACTYYTYVVYTRRGYAFVFTFDYTD